MCDTSQLQPCTRGIEYGINKGVIINTTGGGKHRVVTVTGGKPGKGIYFYKIRIAGPIASEINT